MPHRSVSIDQGFAAISAGPRARQGQRGIGMDTGDLIARLLGLAFLVYLAYLLVRNRKD
jgi:hypothetical protein